MLVFQTVFYAFFQFSRKHFGIDFDTIGVFLPSINLGKLSHPFKDSFLKNNFCISVIKIQKTLR